MPKPPFSAPHLYLLTGGNSGTEGAAPCSSYAADLRRCNVTRREEAIACILEILHAAHLDERSAPAEPLLADRLVEGLITAARLLVDDALPLSLRDV